MLAAAFALLLAQAPPPKPPAELTANLQWALGRPVDAEWQPLLLDLQSTVAKDLDVEILIHEPATDTRLVRRDTVPAGGRRRCFLHLPTGRVGYALLNLQPALTVRGSDGRALAAFTLTAGGRSWSNDEILVGLVTSDRAGDAAFGLGGRAGGSPVEVARLSPELLPDRWIGLAPLRMIVLHDAGLDVLSPEQAKALRDYVRQGGTLLLAPGASRALFTHPAIAAIAAVEIGEPRSATELKGLRRFGPFADRSAFRLHLPTNGRVPPKMEDTGIRDYEAGLGRVVVLPFDLRQAPFDGWAGLPPLMNDLLLGATRADLEWARSGVLPGDGWGGGGRSPLLQRMLALINPYPSFLLLVGLTLVYLVLVGPVNYLLLRRFRMTLLLVVSVPVISIAFLVITLGLAYLIKGRSTTLTTVRLLTTTPDQACARDTRLTTVFSPSTRDYEIRPPSGLAALPFDRSRFDENDRRGSSAPVEIEDGPSPRFRRVSIGQWQSWAFETRAVAELGKGFRWSVRGATLRVENGSPLEVERAILVRLGDGGFSCSPVGALAPGAAVEVPLHASRWTPLDDLGYDEESLGGYVLGPPLAGLRSRRALQSSRTPPAEELLICTLRDAGSGVEVNAAQSGESRSLSLLLVRRESP